jgi:DNA-binding beta-propeller fold protein YncE
MPAGEKLGWVVSGVGVGPSGAVYVLHRGDREWPASDELAMTPIPQATVLVFDGRTGRLIRRWGAGMFAMPHGLTVDQREHVWITDLALQQVFELTADGRVLRTIGERGVAGSDGAHFDRPTKVAVTPGGAFYVSDGYRNSRVVKYAADGRFLLAWGEKGSGPGQFDLPHGIALDRSGRVYVADRGNARVQIFDPSGRYLAEWKGAGYGRPFDVAVVRDGSVVIADGGDIPTGPPDRSSIVVVRQDGRIAERFAQFGLYDGELYRAHTLAAAPDGAIYVGDASGRIQKFRL